MVNISSTHFVVVVSNLFIRYLKTIYFTSGIKGWSRIITFLNKSLATLIPCTHVTYLSDVFGPLDPSAKSIAPNQPISGRAFEYCYFEHKLCS